jgi:hypothetical protein
VSSDKADHPCPIITLAGGNPARRRSIGAQARRAGAAQWIAQSVTWMYGAEAPSSSGVDTW